MCFTDEMHKWTFFNKKISHVMSWTTSVLIAARLQRGTTSPSWIESSHDLQNPLSTANMFTRHIPLSHNGEIRQPSSSLTHLTTSSPTEKSPSPLLPLPTLPPLPQRQHHRTALHHSRHQRHPYQYAQYIRPLSLLLVGGSRGPNKANHNIVRQIAIFGIIVHCKIIINI